MSRGIIAIGIDKDDELMGVRITDGKQIVFLASHEGQAIRFEEEDVRSMGRLPSASAAWTWRKDDYIVGMAVTPKDRTKKSGKDEDANEDTASLILSVTENGYGKRTDVDEYRLQSRGGKGVINVKTMAKNGKVSAIMLVDETSECMVISQFGKIIRINTTSIREAGRSTQGVRLLHLDEGDKVAAAVVIPPDEREENPTLLQ